MRALRVRPRAGARAAPQRRPRAAARADAADAEAKTTPAARARSTLTGADAAAWAAAVTVVTTATGAADGDAEAWLARAHGWGASPYLRGSLVDAVPDPDAVRESLQVLTGDLALSPADAANVVRSFPEALTRDADAQLRGVCLATLDKQWRMRGAAAAGAVKRAPRILGYTVDCAGDCVGECDRCWVRF